MLLLLCSRMACAIPDSDNEEVIISGGYYSGDTYRVSVYDNDGWNRDLQPHKQSRTGHACCAFTLEGEKVYSNN